MKSLENGRLCTFGQFTKFLCKCSIFEPGTKFFAEPGDKKGEDVLEGNGKPAESSQFAQIRSRILWKW